MHSIRSFFRALPVGLCREFLSRHSDEWRDLIDWSKSEPKVRKALNKLVGEIGQSLQQEMQAEVDRVMDLADEAGEAAIRSVVTETDPLEALSGGASRALFLFLRHFETFQRAEEVRFTDEHRRGRTWDDRQGPPEHAIDESSVERFKQCLRERFGWEKAYIDIFDRTRVTMSEQEYRLQQLTILRSGWRTQTREFVGDEPQERSYIPAIEAALTYEPKTGRIEVVAKDKEAREQLPDLFCSEILHAAVDSRVLPRPRYDLSHLKHPQEFPVDAEDGIESVRVCMLRLMPMNAGGARVTIEVPFKSRATIWETAEKQLRSGSLLRSSCLVTQARLTVRFEPTQAHRGRTLPITITMPNGCDLKDRTARERLIGSKYFARWRLLEKADAK